MIRYDDYTVKVTRAGRQIKGDNFNLLFSKATGFTAKFTDDGGDPSYCPYGNEIADIEITTKCHGIRNSLGVNTLCPWCYKKNSAQGDNMSLETFKEIFRRMNMAQTMTQIAFGVDASGTTNPDMIPIFKHCLDHNVTPNVTIADIDKSMAQQLVAHCGAVAVSCYQINKERCYDSVKLLIDSAEEAEKAMAINMHLLVSAETFDFVLEVLEDIKTEPRLRNLNAMVLLGLKQKGRGVSFNGATQEQYFHILDTCFEKKIPFGMDSCSANVFFKYTEAKGISKQFDSQVEACEALLFSAYVDVYGELYPCSFIEGEPGWEKGIKLIDYDTFSEVWRHHPRVLEWRNHCLGTIQDRGCNRCPMFDMVGGCKEKELCDA